MLTASTVCSICTALTRVLTYLRIRHDTSEKCMQAALWEGVVRGHLVRAGQVLKVSALTPEILQESFCWDDQCDDGSTDHMVCICAFVLCVYVWWWWWVAGGVSAGGKVCTM